MSKPIFVLEGPDCSGKSTLAAALKEAMPDAVYVHFSDLRNVKKSLARMYVEAAMPAVMGFAPVIMDRCWLSELPYRNVYRPDTDLRVDQCDIRMIERLMLRCNAIVVNCNPGTKQISKCFQERKGEEYLDSVDQLLQVHDLYNKSIQQTHLDVISFNWLKHDLDDTVDMLVARRMLRSKTMQSRAKFPGTGSINPEVVIIGDRYANHSEFDTHFQWPFASFSNTGCSRWLAYQLDKHRIPENKLWWVNQHDLTDRLFYDMLREIQTIRAVITLGAEALVFMRTVATLRKRVELYHFDHPQKWKRFRSGDDYPFIDTLQELTS